MAERRYSHHPNPQRGQSQFQKIQKHTHVDTFKPLTRTLIKSSPVFSFGDSLRVINPVPTISSDGTDFLVSKHILPGIHQAILQIEKEYADTSDIYVMCPVYRDGGDTQLSVTGSIFRGEKQYEDGIIRELTEELGIVCNTCDLRECSGELSLPGKQWQKTTTFTLNAVNASPFVSSADSHGEDDKSSKVQVVVHGTLGQLRDLTSKITNRAYSKDLKGISGIRLLSFADLKAHVPL